MEFFTRRPTPFSTENRGMSKFGRLAVIGAGPSALYLLNHHFVIATGHTFDEPDDPAAGYYASP